MITFSIQQKKITDADARISLPSNLAFPPNLKKLTLSGCKIPWEKITVVGSLSNLEVLKLRDYAFDGLVWEANEGEFTKLKYLLIDSEVHGCRTFSTTWHLCLNFCDELVKIPAEIGDIATLEMIELCGCRPSAVASAMLIQEEQRSCGNEDFRVRVSSVHDYLTSQRSTSLRKIEGPK
ncbi:UNVERIFIED_CONTAM: hypothetical protein Sradi_4765700 [Sesamum radiatum]|uniref:Uncharacterized protein n=1 Tax=Sesamum radiatum TaxID=300843 RepID=A0AAW2MX89_SESRA